MSKRLGVTKKIELVETHNIALSIERLRQPPYDRERWRRALYHALCMTSVGRQETQKIREALELP